MKIAIIADIHDNIANLKKCIGWCRSQDITEAICAGDVTNAETLKIIAENFSAVYLIRGNMDIYEEGEEEKFENIKFYGRSGVAEIAGQRVGVCHEPGFITGLLTQNCSIIFYGHTHKPWIEERDGVKIINPGTLGGVFLRGTFAYWESEKGILELKALGRL
jgi:uncharacterized protein